MRRLDRCSQWPVHSGDEPLGSGAHAEGAAQPRGSDCGLLARQPGVASSRHHTASVTSVPGGEPPQPEWTGTRCRPPLHSRLHPGPKASGAVVNPAGPNLPPPRWELHQIVPRHSTDCARCPSQSEEPQLCSGGRVVASSDRKLACDSVI